MKWINLPAGMLGLFLLVPAVYGETLGSPATDLGQELLQLARKDDGVDPDLQRRLQEWRSMPEDKRERIKEKREMFERLDPAEKQRLREEFRARQFRKERG